MESKFRSLELLRVRDAAEAREPARLRRLYRNRAFTGLIGAIATAAFSAIPGVFFFLILFPSEEPIPDPGAKWALLGLTGIPACLLAALSAHLFKRVFRDPIRLFYLFPQNFELVEGELIRGEAPIEGEGRRSRYVWDALIAYEDRGAGERRTFTARFDPDLAYSRASRGKRLKGLASLLPAPAWVVYDRRTGKQQALVGIDSATVERVSPRLRTSRSDLVVGFMILLMLAVTPLFWLPLFPDGPWLEVREALPRLPEMKEHCQQLDESVSKKGLQGILPEPGWFVQLQFTAANVDFPRLKAEEAEQLRGVFLFDCRERILAREALARISKREERAIALRLADDVASTHRSVPRLELARDILSALVKRHGTPEERERFEAWASHWRSSDPREITAPKELARWIHGQGSLLRDWLPDFSLRLSKE